MTSRHIMMLALPLALAPLDARADFDRLASINLYVTEPSYLGANDPRYAAIDEGSCADLVSEPVEGLTYVWVVTSREGGWDDGDPYADPGLYLITFGIEHSGVDVLGYVTTSGLSASFDFGFPGSEGVGHISWGGECYGPPGGESARAGLFLLADGTSGRMALTPASAGHNLTGWLSCGLTLHEIHEENLGSIILGQTAEPVCADLLPVKETSWSAIRGLYRSY